MPSGRFTRLAHRFVAVAALGSCLSCGGREVGSYSPTAPSPFSRLLSRAAVVVLDDDGDNPSRSEGVLVGAGDIARCGLAGAELTASLLDGLPGTVFTAGDNAYMNGSAADYRNCYAPTWGRHRSRTMPTLGNHEYHTAGAAGYFGYFGAVGGAVGQGYYSYTVGPWLVLAINSEIPSGVGSAQLQWVRNQLMTSPRCTAVIWHRPLFTSGPNGPNADMQDLWRVLYEMDVDIIINAHDHLFERFALQTPDGRPDPVRGIRQFTVGTGGGPLYQRARSAANSEALGSVWGVTSFTLQKDAYSWAFIPVEGQAFRDSGSGVCH